LVAGKEKTTAKKSAMMLAVKKAALTALKLVVQWDKRKAALSAEMSVGSLGSMSVAD
jgi:hypothetical protein